MQADIENKHNTARFFTEHRHVSWVLLVAVVAWGIYGYRSMPKRKDPDIPVRVATAVTPWPGHSAQEIELLVTRPIEQTIAQNGTIDSPDPTTYGIKSLTAPSVSIIQIQLADNVKDTTEEFNDIALRLDALNASLPSGAGPIRFNSGFGDTAAVLLTVASPKADDVELDLRARDVRQAIEDERKQVGADGVRVTVGVPLPLTVDPQVSTRILEQLRRLLERAGLGRDHRPISAPGFAALDFGVDGDLGNDEILARVVRIAEDQLGTPRFYPDAWDPVVIRDPDQARAALQGVAGDKYTYRQLDDFTDLISTTILTIPQVSKTIRSGVLDRQVFMDYSQERLAQYGIRPAMIPQILRAQNTTVPGGVLEAAGLDLVVTASGEFTSPDQIGDVVLTRTQDGAPVYARSLFDIRDGYESPPRFLSYLTWRDHDGSWKRSRAISVAVLMRGGQQIAVLGAALDRVLADLKTRLPEDLVIVRTSDQPRQVRENVGLFMEALYEAILLVVVVGFIGFREWRSALLLMLSIPITLAMTFGMIYALGIEIQQVSIATLIIALGLLVDDPVVAGDAIKRELADGKPRILAAWLGPTKLAKAIMFATITNIVAYLPFLMLQGTSGEFVRSLPIVMACALIASRVASMTFVPFLGYYLLRSGRGPEPSIEDRRKRGFTGWYYRTAGFAIDHRGKVLAMSLLVLVGGVVAKRNLKNQFFPLDVQYLSYVDIFVRNDASLSSTDEVAHQAEQIIAEVAERYGQEHPGRKGQPRQVLQATYTSVGGGAPRWWYTVTPELNQPNYAQIIVRVLDKDDTPELAPRLQDELSARIPGAYIDVHQLELNAVDYPVAVRIFGRTTIDNATENEDIRTLRALASQAIAILESAPQAARVRHDWGEEAFLARLDIDSDRANLAGITNEDIAASSASGLSGMKVATLRQGDKQIPVVARLRMPERAQFSDLRDLYVYSTKQSDKVPLLELASIEHYMATPRIRRTDHFRTITVFAFPRSGFLASDVFNSVADDLKKFRDQLPPGYSMEICGEEAHRVQGFSRLLTVMAISASAIFLALVLQFNNAVKPLIVFAAVPYGLVGGLVALYVMGTPFAFMAFLGLISLIGVIVSHVIVLFDFIEVMHEKGEPLREALLDAGVVRLRPVLITVGATVLALFPLAVHGGPLWRPLCYAQIGGLTFATGVTLIMVPVLYSIVVLDLKLVKWEGPERAGTSVERS